MKKIILILVMCIQIPVMNYAQSLSNTERRQMNMRVYETILNYERYSSLSDLNAQYQFIDLFRSPEMSIYSDLMDRAGSIQNIDLNSYVNILSKMQLVETEIKDVKKEEPEFQTDGWHILVNFKKSINYVDENGVQFSSSYYYNSDYLMNMDLVYDKDEDRCYIVALQGSMNSSRDHLPDKYWIIQNDKSKIQWLQKNQRNGDAENDTPSYSPLKYNDLNQAFVKYEAKDIVSKNNNVMVSIKKTKKKHIIASTENYQLVNLQAKSINWRVKLRYAMALSGLYKVSSPISFHENKSSASEYGLDAGYTISLGRTTQLGLYTGVAMQQSDLSLSQDNINYSLIFYSYDPNYSYNTEDSAEKNERQYNNILAKEYVKYKNLVIPVYIAFDHNFGKALAFTWNLGAKFYMSSTVDDQSYNISGTVNGQTIGRSFNEFLYPSYYSHDQSISLVGGAGFNINLVKRMVYLNVKANYEYGLGKVHTAEEKQLFTVNKYYPLVYSEASKTDIATRSFMDCISVSRQGFWLEGGLMFKF